MKKLAILCLPLLLIAGCNKPVDPTPTPSVFPTPIKSPSDLISKPPKVPSTPTQTVTKTEVPEDSDNATPAKPEVSMSEAGTPATQFASRWGKRYPSVPEFAILKAANAICRTIETSGDNWINSELAKSAIEVAVGAAGLNENDAVEFAQDAQQNYCSSVSNPT